MRLTDFMYPFAVFTVGVIVLAIGYFIYVAGMAGDDAAMRDSGPPIENLGVVLMIAGIVLHLIVTAANRALDKA